MEIISLNRRDQIFSIASFLIILIFHFFCIEFYPVNDEFIFPIGAKLIESKDISLIKSFFDFNANTLGFSTLIFLVSKIIHLEYYLIGKILSVTGLIFIFFGIINFLKIISFKPKIELYYLILLIFLNPLIFNFSLRATPDFFSMSVIFLSVSMLIRFKNKFSTFFNILIISMATFIKPFNFIFILLIFKDLNYSYLYSKNNLRLIYIFILTLFISASLFLFNYYLFSFLIIPENFELAKDFEILSYCVQLISYVGILNIFISPIYLNLILSNIKKNVVRYMFYLITSLFLSYFIMFRVGEIDFGFLTEYLNTNFYLFLLTMSFFVFVDTIFSIYKKNIANNKLFINYFLILIIFLIFLSNFHPTQRYLLILIPFSTLFFYLINQSKITILIAVYIYFLANIPLFINHYSTQKNIGRVLNFLMSEKIISQTYPGFLGQHSLNYFMINNENSKIEVNKNILFNKNKKFNISDLKPFDEKDIIFVSKSQNIFKRNKNIYIYKN